MPIVPNDTHRTCPKARFVRLPLETGRVLLQTAPYRAETHKGMPLSCLSSPKSRHTRLRCVGFFFRKRFGAAPAPPYRPAADKEGKRAGVRDARPARRRLFAPVRERLTNGFRAEPPSRGP